VDDSAEYRTVATAVLSEAGHRVRGVGTLAEARQLFDASPVDLVVLDLTLPDGDGLDFCSELRSRSSVYVIMLTARTDEIDKLIGFRIGADDYITKPFSSRELTARVAALARRPRTADTVQQHLQLGILSIDRAAREVRVGETDVVLTKLEFDLLVGLATRRGSVVTRDQLRDAVWGENWYGDGHVVDVHMSKLRKKLSDSGADGLIVTVRGVGYKLSA
jgi:DNA-binding response OmpR family regulator